MIDLLIEEEVLLAEEEVPSEVWDAEVVVSGVSWLGIVTGLLVDYEC